jgi:hypothetical protein
VPVSAAVDLFVRSIHYRAIVVGEPVDCTNLLDAVVNSIVPAS